MSWKPTTYFSYNKTLFYTCKVLFNPGSAECRGSANFSYLLRALYLISEIISNVPRLTKKLKTIPVTTIFFDQIFPDQIVNAPHTHLSRLFIACPKGRIVKALVWKWVVHKEAIEEGNYGANKTEKEEETWNKSKCMRTNESFTIQEKK